MRMRTSIAFMIACGALAACGDKPATSCIGKVNSDVPVERMDEVDKFFLLTDFSRYAGSPVSKLEHDFVIHFRERNAVTNPQNELKWMEYTFRNNYTVRVYLSEVKYTRFKNGRWDFSRLGRETIAGVNVSHTGAGDFYYCKDYGAIHL